MKNVSGKTWAWVALIIFLMISIPQLHPSNIFHSISTFSHCMAHQEDPACASQ